MDRLKSLMEWMTSLPTSGKVICTIITTLVSILLLFCACSCGQTRAVARTSDRGVTTITITTNNPTSVEASPDVDLNLTPNLN